MEVCDYLKALIAFDTTSSNESSKHQSNEPLINYIRELLLERNYVVAKFKVEDGNFNLLALSPSLFCKATAAAKSDLGVLLSGHSDCVPFNKDKWHSDPLVLNEREGKYYGRGSVDMKGFLACMLKLTEEIHAQYSTQDLAHYPAISLLFTANEECSMCGAQAFAALAAAQADNRAATAAAAAAPAIATLDRGQWQSSTRVKSCLLLDESALQEHGLALLQGTKRFAMIQIGEPTMMQPVVAHKGWLAREMEILGCAGHSSNPHGGLNAIELSAMAIESLQKLQAKLEHDYTHESFSVPYATLNLGLIQGGQSFNSICDQVKIGFDLRPTPNLSLERINELLSELLEQLQPLAWQQNQAKMQRLNAKLCKLHGQSTERFECFKITQPFPDTPAFASNSNTLKELLEKALQIKPDYQYVNYCTEASFLQQVAPCVVLGPGNIAQAHGVDEYIEKEQLSACELYLQNLLRLRSAQHN